MTIQAAIPEAKLEPITSTATAPAVDIVVPIFNEEPVLTASIRKLHDYLREEFPFSARITIADNASTDHSWDVAQSLAVDLDGVRALRIDEAGRGRALHAAWSQSDAQVLCYMDVDLSTDLAALLPLVAPLLSGHSDVAIGTRLARSARVVRGPKRELISRSYNMLVRAALSARFSDAQCGFKAIRADHARWLLPLVEDNGWFFDTELLVLAERAGLRIHEVPVDWVDDLDSRVAIVRTAMDDVRGIVRLLRNLAADKVPLDRVGEVESAPRSGPRPGVTQQLIRFGAVGVASTLAYLVLYLLLRTQLGATTSNAIALLITAVLNTAANRSFTFGVRGRRDRVRHQVRGLVAFAAGLAISTAALDGLHRAASAPSRALEVVVLVGANLAATALRFLLYRQWVFTGHNGSKQLESPRITTDGELS